MLDISEKRAENARVYEFSPALGAHKMYLAKLQDIRRLETIKAEFMPLRSIPKNQLTPEQHKRLVELSDETLKIIGRLEQS